MSYRGGHGRGGPGGMQKPRGGGGPGGMNFQYDHLLDLLTLPKPVRFTCAGVVVTYLGQIV